MCSIIGASVPKGASINPNDVRILYLMAETRGGHACGFTDGEYIVKKAFDAYSFVHKTMRNEAWSKFFTKDGRFRDFIGHTRKATVGDKANDDNAHPFLKENLVGVHNGSIYNHADIKMLVDDSESVVDSEIMYDAIDKYGLLKVLPLLNGVLALNYFDRKNDSIKVYRQDRPLSYGYKYVEQPDGTKAKIMFWASLPEYLEAIDVDKIKPFKQNVLYTIKNGKIAQGRQVKYKLRPTPPKVIKKNDVQMQSKEVCLDIWTEKEEQLLNLGMKGMQEMIATIKSEREAEKKKKAKSSAVVSGFNNSNSDKSSRQQIAITVYENTSLSQVPLHSIGVLSKALGYLFFWFDAEIPNLVRIYSDTLELMEAYDLEEDEDERLLAKNYGNDDSEIVQEIMQHYNTLIKPTYEMRIKLEADGKTTNACEC